MTKIKINHVSALSVFNCGTNELEATRKPPPNLSPDALERFRIVSFFTKIPKFCRSFEKIKANTLFPFFISSGKIYTNFGCYYQTHWCLEGLKCNWQNHLIILFFSLVVSGKTRGKEHSSKPTFGQKKCSYHFPTLRIFGDRGLIFFLKTRANCEPKTNSF